MVAIAISVLEQKCSQKQSFMTGRFKLVNGHALSKLFSKQIV